MWGPHGRRPYTRSYRRVKIFSLIAAAVYKAAGAIDMIRVNLLQLTGKYLQIGYRARRRPGLLIRGEHKIIGRTKKQAIIRAAVVYVMAGALQLQAAYKRSLAAGYAVTGKAVKRVYLYCLGTAVFIASRLRLQKVIGWGFLGDFEPGDVIKIDSKALTITKNGVNVLELFSGQHPILNPGAGAAGYSDTAAGRNIRIKTFWKGRWV